MPTTSPAIARPPARAEGRGLRRAAAALLAVLALGAAAATPPPLEHFFRRPMLDSAALAPDGWRVAMRSPGPDGRQRLAVLDLRTREPQIVASFPDTDVGPFRWINANRLVFTLQPERSATGSVPFGPGLFAVDADGKRFRQLVHTVYAGSHSSGREPLPVGTQWVADHPGTESNDIFVRRAQEVSREMVGYYQLFKVDSATGATRELDSPTHAISWVFDHQGEPRLAVGREGGERVLHLREPAGRWREVARHPWLSAEAVEPRAVGPDGTFYAEALHGDTSAVYTLDPANGRRAAEPIVAAKAFDLHPAFLFGRDRLLGLRYEADAEVTLWLDKEMEALQDRIDRQQPGRVNRIELPRHGDSPWVLVHSWSDRQPVVVQVFHRGSGQWLRLGGAQPHIDPRAMGGTEFLRFKARDGLEIPAYLTRPPGGGKNLPLLVWVHGGPWVRGGSWRWDPELQFLATRGYAVLRPEFRGSTGYGAALFQAGFRQWGRAMQDDLTDAARWAVAQGIADPKRICLIGASYGGYATMMGLIREPELFRCGVQWVGVADPGMMFTVGWSDITQSAKRHGLSQLIGDPVADAERMREVSPLVQAARLKQPLLMAYGSMDRRVPLVHGEKLRDALKPHNPSVEWVVYNNEGHGWSRPETQLDFWARVERFLQRELAAR